MFRISAATTPKRAIAYYRHSAEDRQEFSVPIQRERTEEFARREGIEIIHEESDEGVTGMTANRPGYQRLFKEWITNPAAPDFQYVLVLDVTRWGRFEDMNEPAHYEFMCTTNRKEVIYVTRGMPNEKDRLASSVVTVMERFEAFRFSERLSEKVSYGSLNISKQGYSVGGIACYGLARMLLDEQKQFKGILKKGEHKAIANERVMFIPANDETTGIVKEIFDLFVNRLETPKEIAIILNERGIPSPSGKTWRSGSIIRILDNEAYIGTRIYNKTWNKLKKGHRKNPMNDWVIVPHAFPAVIEEIQFRKARERLYWMIPARWKRGILATKKASRLIEQELQRVLFEQGVDKDDVLLISRNLPIIYGVSSSLESAVARWCFLIPHEMRAHKYVLAIGVQPDGKGRIDRVFLVPTREFGWGDFRILSERDPAYGQYRLKEEEVEEKVLSMVKQLGISIEENKK